ncbi:probable gamma-secretase subunit PEN-2 [Zingiber officinale]|uniref:Gamma-secretase subunit PEN-2 n=1 Tax=Zingiber officinale TaxID=94328 RepID=A0A8J5M8S1_ZINOF|nr:probable gamma-secretase subunit PEN-2 [Zingiber officinale]XP_042441264.1 probable gamma-secretase subunit PEN-2 [Zingiber officinale]KAG6536582.1 hypothetical protein ZIOFF_001640 [Zingiber officinale]
MEPIDEERGLIGHRSTAGTSTAVGEGNPTQRTWPTVDGPHGLSEEESLRYARSYFYWGFALLPFLWAVNCCYFWPVLRNSHSSPQIRPYVTRSAIGFSVFSLVLATWSLTFIIGGELLFGPVWNELVMYNLADKWGLTGWT